ncbi:MAG: ATP-dependent DNA helicase RecG [Pseudanabaenaceae cyanobacterium]
MEYIERLQKCLKIEEEHGFPNVQGKQYLFGEFLQLSLGNIWQEVALDWQEKEKNRALQLAREYSNYPHLSGERRKELVIATRAFLEHIQKRLHTSAPIVAERTPQILPPQNTELDTPLREVPKISPKQAEKLKRLELFTVRDLLHYYPRGHVDYGRQVCIGALQEGDTATIIGSIRKFNCFTSPKNLNLCIMEILVQDRTGKIRLNRYWMGKRYTHPAWQEQQRKLYPVGAVVAAAGTVKPSKFGLTLAGFDLEVLDHPQDTITSDRIGRIIPVYPLKEGVTPELMRQAVIACLPYAQKVVDVLPEQLKRDYGLMDLGKALQQVHYPDSQEALQQAAMRLTFDKYFYRRLVFLYRRQQRQTASFLPPSYLVAQMDKLLPFHLTNAQRRVIEEIRRDLQKTTPMNRLVQGDVGSGKTIVAVYAILAAIESGYQTALMAPTEVLAEQHYRKIVEWFIQLNLPVELLTGSTKPSKKREILGQLETGTLPLVIGTHALIQEGVKFYLLGLAVIDEQHRFGTVQRSQLLQKGNSPHVLIMTATPIPRTLYLTNSEIDVSVIDELPPNRQPIKTVVLRPSQRHQAYELIKREVVQGRQAYIVFSLIDESEKMEDVKAAMQQYEYLQQSVFPYCHIGLLHGQMTPTEKDQAIAEFRSGKTQILVATTVVEVGVDVPNASVMLIENAERFGLAQLHQLRGRVGRGSAQSYCLLISGSRSETAIERLQILEQSQDGFYIAERDMEMRGKGRDEGTEQSGHAGLVIEDLITDPIAKQEVLQWARQAAERVLKKSPSLDYFPKLKLELAHHYERLAGGAIFT